MSVRECRIKLPLPELWRREGWKGEGPIAGKREQKVVPPYREVRTGSMNITMQGELYTWFDHGEGCGGDELTLLMRMRGLDKSGAIAVYHELAGVPMDAPKRSGKGGGLGRIVACYDYLDAEGRLLHQTVRFEPKNFLQRRPGAPGLRQGDKEAKCDKETGRWWLWTLAGIEPVLYHLPEILARRHDEVWLVEGEKDADALARHGLLTTTCPMGAKKWRASYTEVLRGRRVVLCGDSDHAGVGHLLAVGELLEAAGCTVVVVDWCEVIGPMFANSEKWDAAKYLATPIN